MEFSDHLKKFYKKHDRIQYLAMRVVEVRKKLITDDWIISHYLKKWSIN